MKHIAGLFLVASAVVAQDAQPVVEVVRKARNSVVVVSVPRLGQKDIVGSGVILDGGLIVTCRHVIAGAGTVTIHLRDGTKAIGEVLHADAANDLAIIRAAFKNKPPSIKLACEDPEPGETVIAIGHPYGYKASVCTGIVSATGREIRMPTGDTLTGLIQTSAPINVGNSGGPLLNIRGELIGINVAMREGAQGIGFAVAAAAVCRIVGAIRPDSGEPPILIRRR